MELTRTVVKGALFASLIALPIPLSAHGGGLDASGCHNDRQRGGYHCHNGGGFSSPIRRATRAIRNVEPSFLVAQPQPTRDAFDGRLESIQKMLVHLGYDPGPVDGSQGAMTQAAIRQFQKDRGHAETGLASGTLVDQLIAAIAD